jgi:hypothetical protein
MAKWTSSNDLKNVPHFSVEALEPDPVANDVLQIIAMGEERRGEEKMYSTVQYSTASSCNHH